MSEVLTTSKGYGDDKDVNATRPMAYKEISGREACKQFLSRVRLQFFEDGRQLRADGVGAVV
jgi:hypothetical protein